MNLLDNFRFLKYTTAPITCKKLILNLPASHKIVSKQNKKVKLLAIVLLSSILISTAIVFEKLILILPAAGFILYFNFSIHTKILLLALGAMFPISFGPLGPIAHFYWFEWMAPLLAAMLAVELFLFNKKRLFFKGHALLYSAFLALSITIVVNYIRNPVFSQSVMGVSETAAGIRIYYDILAGLNLTFVLIWYFRYFFQDPKSISRFLTFIAIFSICLGFLQLTAFLLKFQLPFMYSTFRFEHITFGGHYYSGTAFRIGGMSECAMIGIPAILSLTYRKKMGIAHIISLLLCGLILFLSGGRANTVGVLVAFAVYTGLCGSKRMMLFIFFTIILVILFWVLVSSGYIGGQWKRLVSITEGYSALDRYRTLTYKLMLESFIQNPIFGKGVGYIGSGKSGAMKFAMKQLAMGGHGAYISTIAIFGLFGLIFLLASLFFGIIKAIGMIRQSIPYTSSLAMFCLLLLIIKATSYLVGGTGYSDMHLYFCIGILAGLSERTGVVNGYE